MNYFLFSFLIINQEKYISSKNKDTKLNTGGHL